MIGLLLKNADVIMSQLDERFIDDCPAEDVENYIEVYRNILLIILQSEEIGVSDKIIERLSLHRLNLSGILSNALLKMDLAIFKDISERARDISTVAKRVEETIGIIDKIIAKKSSEEEVSGLFEDIHGWCNTIKLSTKADGTDDTALIIQELIEKHFHKLQREF